MANKINNKGQMVFIAVIFGLLSFLVFFVSLPVLLEFIASGKSAVISTYPFVAMVLDFFPFMLFLMISYITLKLARMG